NAELGKAQRTGIEPATDGFCYDAAFSFQGVTVRSRMLLLVALSLCVLGGVISAQQPTAPPPVRSPEVSPDRRVTFRISAPTAKSVAVVCECFTLEQIARLKQEQAELVQRRATDHEVAKITRAIQATQANQGERA